MGCLVTHLEAVNLGFGVRVDFKESLPLRTGLLHDTTPNTDVNQILPKSFNSNLAMRSSCARSNEACC